jgi:chromatin remodeling complex protein RSC6
MLFQIACDVDLKTLFDVNREMFDDTDLLIEQSRHGQWYISHMGFERYSPVTRLFILYTSNVDAISKINHICDKNMTKCLVTYHFK